MPDTFTARPTGERRSPSSFEYYNAGSFDGDGPDLFVFTCWTADHVSCGTHSVYAPDLVRNILALEEAGYINRTEASEYWNYNAGAWVQGPGRQRVADTVRPSGLPIFCTEPLTAAERKGLEALIEQHQTQANLLKLALLAGTVAGALGAMRVGVLLGQAEEAMSLKLGINR